MRTKYRIIRDNYYGYEVQIKDWWSFMWRQLAVCNSHSSLEKAKKQITQHKERNKPIYTENA